MHFRANALRYMVLAVGVVGKECSHVRDVANKCLYIDNKAKSLLPSPEPASQPTGYYDDIEVALKRPRGSVH